MIRVLVPGILALAAAAAACDGATTRYEVTVRFNTSVTQDGLDEAAAVLRSYDEGLDFLVQESFPPTGRAFLSTGVSDFCPQVRAELEAKPYVDGMECGEHREPPSGSPDEPVSSE